MNIPPMHIRRFDTAEQTLAIFLDKTRMAQVIYWGTSLSADTDLSDIVTATTHDIPKSTPDTPQYISVLPVDGQCFYGMAGVSIRDVSGRVMYPVFVYDRIHQDVDTTQIVYTDAVHGLTYTMYVTAHHTANVFALHAEITSTDKVIVDWLSAPVLPAPADADTMVDFCGRWCAEMQPNTVQWTTGIRYRESRLGRSSHEHYPALVIPTRGHTQNTGGVYGFHYGWSGGHRMIAEQLQDGTRQVQFGHATGSYSDADTHFTTAPLYITYTDKGINGMAQSFHKLVHNRFMGVRFMGLDTPRPVNYNCWEAVYFNHCVTQLQQIADKAHSLGAERFVLDDGWFGTRNDNSSSLGDWHVNPQKFPDGLTPLIDHVNGLGMQFGIWFEPEMISPNSILNKTHPEWVLGGQSQVTSRKQWVLNMALAEVQDYLYDKIAHMLTTYNIAYIKWDHNRIVPQVRAAQTEGTYAVLHRLNRDFPHVEIESCSAGGGRMDYGILPYTKRVWLSDCNDAYERLIMQYNASMWLPHAVVGSHVGPRISHSTARIVPMHFRAWVAASRHMGFEMDPNEVTEAEAIVLKRVVQWYKHNRMWIFNGTAYRLPVQQHAIFPEMTVSQDRSQFVVFIGKYQALQSTMADRLHLVGVDPTALYEMTFVNKGDLDWAIARDNTTALHRDSTILSGEVLMQVGIALPNTDPGTMMVLQGRRVQVR